MKVVSWLALAALAVVVAVFVVANRTPVPLGLDPLPYELTAPVFVLVIAALFALLFFFMFEMVRLKGPVFFSSVNYIAPIAGIVFAMIIFGESLSPWLWAALALMFAGLATLNYSMPARAHRV